MKLLEVNIISKIVKGGHGHVNGGAIVATRLVIIDKSLNDSYHLCFCCRSSFF